MNRNEMITNSQLTFANLNVLHTIIFSIFIIFAGPLHVSSEGIVLSLLGSTENKTSIPIATNKLERERNVNACTSS